MVFSSFEFLFRFLPVFLLMYYVTPQKWKNAVLFAGSILFYTAGEAEYVVLLLASVVCVSLRSSCHHNSRNPQKCQQILRGVGISLTDCFLI